MENFRVITQGNTITHLSYHLHKMITSTKPDDKNQEAKTLSDLMIKVNNKFTYLDVYFRNGKFNAYFTNEKQLLIYKLENYES